MADLFAGVVVDTPLDKIFHYRIPPPLCDTLAEGDRVVVPFGPQRLHGVVVERHDTCPIDPARVKTLLSVSTPDERIPPSLLTLTRWVATYYRSGWGTVLTAALPAAVRAERRGPTRRHLRLLVPPDDARREADRLARAPRQAEVLRRLANAADPARDAPPYADLPLAALDALPAEPVPSESPGGLLETTQPGTDHGNEAAPPRPRRTPSPFAAALKTLAARGLVGVEDRPWTRDGGRDADDVAGPSAAPEPTPAQATALEHIRAALDTRAFAPFLLYGVTGSGKTEVYLRALAHTLAMDRTVLMLVPEISLTPQTVARFRARSPAPIAVLHSHMADGERAAEWRRIARGEARVVVGARSAVFAPLHDVGLVVVDEEHERSYKQDNDPRYHGRDVAVVRARQAGAVVLLGSATPAMESWQNAREGKYRLLTLPDRPGRARPVEVDVVDLRREWVDVKRPTIISRTLERALREALERGEQAILFLNRRGFHTTARCRACGDVLQCGECDIPLTYHRAQHRLRCHYCGRDMAPPEKCPACSHPGLQYVGTGVERVEDVLRGVLPDARTLRMDADTMSAAGAHAAALARFGRGEADILLGTQMVAKGLDFPNVTVVGVLQADGALTIPEFRAAERTFQLVTQVVGRAGRAERPGRAVVQAFQPDHHAIRAAIAQDYEQFVTWEAPDREALDYPPYGRLARVLLRGTDESKTALAADEVIQRLRATAPSAASGTKVPDGKNDMPSDGGAVGEGRGVVLGPAPCFLSRVQGEYRFHLLLKTSDPMTRARWLDRAAVHSGERGGVRTTVDIDPQSLL